MYFKCFPSCNHMIMNGTFILTCKICHAQALDLSYHELSFSFLVAHNLLLEMKIDIVKLISFFA
jgi:hypothetical protein